MIHKVSLVTILLLILSSCTSSETPILSSNKPSPQLSASHANVLIPSNIPVLLHECAHDHLHQISNSERRFVRGFQNYPTGAMQYAQGADGRGTWTFKRRLSSKEIFGGSEMESDQPDFQHSIPNPSLIRSTPKSRISRSTIFNENDDAQSFGKSFSISTSDDDQKTKYKNRKLQNVYPTKTSSASGPPLPSGPTKTSSRTQTRSRSSSSTPSTLPSATPSPYPSCSCQQAIWTTDPGNVTNADLASMKLTRNYTRLENGTFLFYTSYLFAGLLTPVGNTSTITTGNDSSFTLRCNIGWGTNAKLDRWAPSPSPSITPLISPSNSPRFITITSTTSPTPYPTCVNITNPTPSSSMTSSSSPSPSMQPAPVWVQLRITPIYFNITTDSVGMSPSKIDFLQNVLMKNAILKWSNLLMTIPVAGNLFASRECTSWWTTTTPASCAAFAQVTTCGPGGSPSTSDLDDDVAIPLPPEYLLRQNNFTLLNTTAKFGSPDYGLVTPDMYFPRGSGLPATDFAIFVTTQHVTGRCAPPGSTRGALAYSMTCQRDQFDRPTWARINVCPFALLDPLTSLGYDGLNGYLYRSQLNAILHELGHALGFSSLNWPLHRTSLSDYLRSPKTPRDPKFPGQTSEDYVAYYSCGSSNRKNVNQRDVPANNTVAYFNERGSGDEVSCPINKFIGRNASIPLDAEFTGPGNSWSGRQVGRSGMAGRGSVVMASMDPSSTPSLSPTPSVTPSNTTSPLATTWKSGVSRSNTQTTSPTQTPSKSPTATRSFTSSTTSTPAPPPSVFSLAGCVHKLVGPRVKAAAIAYFDCEDIQGGELENQLYGDDVLACDFQGSHWESRILAHEIMATNVGHFSKIGPLTLAALEDSGWYLANYSNADGFVKGSSWGYQMGCAFAFQSTCLSPANISADESGSSSPRLNEEFADSRHFYTSSRNQSLGNSVCTLDRSSVASVEVIDFSAKIPKQFQYFMSPYRGGSNLRFDANGFGAGTGMIPEMNNIVNGSEYAASFDTFDYCPVAQAVGVSMDISDKNLYIGQVSFMERDVPLTQTRRCSSYVDGLRRSAQLSAYGEIYGPSSACFESTLSVTGGVTRGAKLPRPIGAGCFQYECDKQNPGSLFIIINGTASNGDVSRSEVLYHKVLCDYRRGGLSFSVPNFDGVIVCPEGGADVLCREPEVVDVPYPLSMLVNRTSPLVSILPTPSNSPTISTTPSGSSSFKLPSATPSETPSGSTSPGPMCVTAVLVLENVYAENVTSKLSNFSSQTMPIYAALINYSSTFVKVASVKQVQKQIEVRARRLSDDVSSPLYHPLYQSENSTATMQRSLATTTSESCYCTNATLYNVTGIIVPSSRNCSSGPGSNSALFNPLSTATASTPYLGTCSNTTISSGDSQLILIIRYYAYVSIDTLAATSTVNDVIANIVKGFLPPQEMSSWDAYFNTQETIRLSLLDELTEKISNVIGISKSSFSLYLLSTPTAKAGLGSFDIPPLPPDATDNSVLLALVGSLLPFLLIFAFLAGIEWLKRFREKMIAVREINPILLPEDRSTVAKPAPKNFLPRSLWNLETRLRQERIEKIELGHLEPMTEEDMKIEVKAHAECIRMKKKWNREEWKKDYKVSKMLITASEENEEEKGSTEKSERVVQEDDVIVSENDSVFKPKVSVEVPTVLFFNANESIVDAKTKKVTGKDVHNVHEGSEDVVPVSTPRNVHSVPLPTLTSFLTYSQPADNNDHVLLHVDDLHFDSFTNNDIVKYQEKVAGLTKTDIRPETASSTDSRHNEVASHVSTLLPELQQNAKEAGNTCESMRQEILELEVCLKSMSITPKQRRITTEKLTELRKGLKIAEARSARANAALASASAIAFAQVSTARPTSKNVSDDHHDEVKMRMTHIGVRVPLDRSEFGLFTHLDTRALISIFSELHDYEKPGCIGELSHEEREYPPPSVCDLCRVRRAMRTCYNCDQVPVIMTDQEMSSLSFLEDVASSTGYRSLPNPKGTKLRFLHTCIDCFVFTHGKNINMRLHSFADLTNVDSRLAEYAPGGPLHKLLLDRADAAQQYAETTIKTIFKSSNFEIDDKKEVDLEGDVNVEDEDSVPSEAADENDEGSEDDSDYVNNSVGYQEEGKETDEDKELMIGVEGKECEGKESEDLYRQVQHESKEEEKKNEELGDASPTNEEGDIPGRVIQW
jgi:hypothetical protein